MSSGGSSVSKELRRWSWNPSLSTVAEEGPGEVITFDVGAAVPSEADKAGEAQSEATKMISAMDFSLLSELPSHDDVTYDLTCVICSKDSGPPALSCIDGHRMCWECQLSEGKQAEVPCLCSCKYENYDTDEVEICRKPVYGIDEPIKKTEYFKLFIAKARFSCASQKLGCPVVSSFGDVEHHESQQCAYSYLRVCPFVKEECSASFQTLAANLSHIITAHNVPVCGNQEGHFKVRFDRVEPSAERDDGPLIRAVVFGNRRKRTSIVCLIMGQDIGNKTRLWVARFDDDKKRKRKLSASLCVCPETPSSIPKEEIEKKSKEFELSVLEDIKRVATIDRLKKEYFVDLSHTYLDSIMEVVNGKKYFNLLVEIHVLKDVFDKDDEDAVREREAKRKTPEKDIARIEALTEKLMIDEDDPDKLLAIGEQWRDKANQLLGKCNARDLDSPFQQKIFQIRKAFCDGATKLEEKATLINLGAWKFPAPPVSCFKDQSTTEQVAGCSKVQQTTESIAVVSETYIACQGGDEDDDDEEFEREDYW